MGLQIILVALIFAAGLCAQGSTRAPLTPERIWDFVRVEGGGFNAAGTDILVVEKSTDLASEVTSSTLSVVNKATLSRKVILKGVRGLSDPEWGRFQGADVIYALLPADGSSQLHRISLEGQCHAVTRVAGGVQAARVSADGRFVVYSARVKLDPQLHDLHPDLPKADARIIDSLLYRHWNEWADGSYSHLFSAPLDDDGKAVTGSDLMPGLRAHCPMPPTGGREQFAISPNGREVAFAAKLVNRPERSTDSDIYVVPMGGGELKNLTQENQGYDLDPVYSPSGKQLAWLSMEHAGFEADKSRLMLLDLASDERRDLSDGFDASTHDPVFTADGDWIWFNSETQGTVQLYRVKAVLEDGEGTAPEVMTQGAINWALAGMSPVSNEVVLSRQSMLRPPELVLRGVQWDREDRPLTAANDALMATLDLPQVEEHFVRATDGRRIQSWVVLPPNFDKTKKYPMLLYCQGGPQSQIGQSFSFRWNFHLMAAKGYVVLAVNRRGLPGFGQEWNDAISGDWGGQAMQDLLAACDHMTAQPWIDARRVGAVGASFGGYSVYWLMGNGGDRFRAMIAHCGVFNLESMYGGTEELFFVDWDLGGAYWANEEARARYERFSPHRFVGQWKTPLLVIHGEQDFRVPVGQGMEAFTAAQSRGVPSRFLYFPGECHWVLRPQNAVLWQRVFFDWLQRNMGN